MKFRIIKNRSGKYQPQIRRCFIWWNFYGAFRNMEEFDDFNKVDLYIREHIKYLKNNNQQVLVIKEYNYDNFNYE